MKNNITGGDWNAKDGQIYSLQTGKTLALIPYWDNEPEQAANAELLANAGATANRCGLLPSELLAQRNELLEACKDSFRILTLSPTNDNLYQRNKLFALINKIKGEQP